MKKFFFIAAVWLYIFIALGFILHTSLDKEEVFSKYSWTYFAIIVLLLLIFIPYFFAIRYIVYKSSRKKIVIMLLGIILIVGITETFMRVKGIYVYKPQYDITNFHPFLQHKLTKDTSPDTHINEYGFRAEEITKTKKKDVYRIVVLGGSTAYGVSVPYQKTTPKLLQDMLTKHYGRKIEILNAGVPGYTSEHSVIDYEFRVSDFKPDLVIMWHGINDMSASCADPNAYTYAGSYASDYSHLLGPLANMISSYFFPPVLGIHLVSVDYTFDALQKYMYTDLVSFVKNARIRSMAKVPQENKTFPSLASYQRNLRYFITVVRSDNAKIILGNQPNMLATYEKAKYSPDGIFCYDGKTQGSLASQASGIKAFNKVTEKVAKENDVPFINLDSALPRNSAYFLDGVHWTETGHKVAAEQLYKFIISGNFISEVEDKE